MNHPAEEQINLLIEKFLGKDPILVRYRELVDKKYIEGISLEESKEVYTIEKMIDISTEDFSLPITYY